MASETKIVIASAKRTPIGAFNGNFSSSYVLNIFHIPTEEEVQTATFLIESGSEESVQVIIFFSISSV